MSCHKPYNLNESQLVEMIFRLSKKVDSLKLKNEHLREIYQKLGSTSNFLSIPNLFSKDIYYNSYSDIKSLEFSTDNQLNLWTKIKRNSSETEITSTSSELAGFKFSDDFPSESSVKEMKPNKDTLSLNPIYIIYDSEKVELRQDNLLNYVPILYLITRSYQTKNHSLIKQIDEYRQKNYNSKMIKNYSLPKYLSLSIYQVLYTDNDLYCVNSNQISYSTDNYDNYHTTSLSFYCFLISCFCSVIEKFSNSQSFNGTLVTEIVHAPLRSSPNNLLSIVSIINHRCFSNHTIEDQDRNLLMIPAENAFRSSVITDVMDQKRFCIIESKSNRHSVALSNSMLSNLNKNLSHTDSIEQTFNNISDFNNTLKNVSPIDLAHDTSKLTFKLQKLSELESKLSSIFSSNSKEIKVPIRSGGSSGQHSTKKVRSVSNGSVSQSNSILNNQRQLANIYLLKRQIMNGITKRDNKLNNLTTNVTLKKSNGLNSDRSDNSINENKCFGDWDNGSGTKMKNKIIKCQMNDQKTKQHKRDITAVTEMINSLEKIRAKQKLQSRKSGHRTKSIQEESKPQMNQKIIPIVEYFANLSRNKTESNTCSLSGPTTHRQKLQSLRDKTALFINKPLDVEKSIHFDVNLLSKYFDKELSCRRSYSKTKLRSASSFQVPLPIQVQCSNNYRSKKSCP